MSTNEPRRAAVEPEREVDWELVRRFHGHLGPWVGLGLRLGRSLLEASGAPSHFGLEVRVECPLAPPVSCLLDGLQWATGATYGKQNLTATAAERIVVRLRRDGATSTWVATVSPQARTLLAGWMAELGEDAASQRAYDAPPGALFEITEESDAE